METALSNHFIFGPIQSRRFGNSLGINVLPLHSKFCNFNCLYCECGWTNNYLTAKNNLPDASVFSELLMQQIELLVSRGIKIDTITFAGNGEPTIHPDFDQIVEDVIIIRDVLLPETKIVVLTNATMLHKERVVIALKKVDECMFKLDAGTDGLFQTVNQPLGKTSLERVVKKISKFTSKPIIQSMFFRGVTNGKVIDNTTEEELTAWKKHLLNIQAKKVVIYSLDRPTPASELEKISYAELCKIGNLLEDTSIEVMIV